jgi:Xaa-Pro aminopeptidase
MTVSRRSLIKGLAAGGAAASLASCAATAPRKIPGPALTLPDTPDQPVFNHAHAVDVMQREGVDLVICGDPVNVYYLTNHRIVSNSLGMDGMAFASFAASGRSKPALLTGKFSYYLSSDDKTVPSHIDLKLFTSPAEPDIYQTLTDPEDLMSAPASDGYITPTFASEPFRDYEKARRDTITAATADVAASSDAALLRALRDADLPNKTVAVDNPNLIATLNRSGLDIRFVDGERLLRRIRLQKSPAELVFMRYAAAENAAAALAAARTVREGATFQEMRIEFAKACGARLLTPGYLLIDGVFAPLTQTKFEAGRSFLIDGVSDFEGYHGDYGRTVCVGEPGRRMQGVVDALSFVWDRVLPELKVGVTYAEIWALGQKLFTETGVDAGLVMGPHAVGLHHTDEPGATEFGPFAKDNLTLQKNMVISVDMPVLGSGLGGAAHLEDLVLITEDGPELLNPGDNRLIIV